MAKITTAYKGDKPLETQIGKQTIDVPDIIGGSDREAMPSQLFIASPGSRAGAFVATYCNEHKIDSDDLKVDTLFDKSDNVTRLTKIKTRVEIPHTECKNRADAIQHVVPLCLVHETINTLDGIPFEIVDKANRQPT